MSIRIRHGRMLTKRRRKLVKAYLEKRHRQVPRCYPTGSHWQYRWEWCSDFERFLLHGYP